MALTRIGKQPAAHDVATLAQAIPRLAQAIPSLAQAIPRFSSKGTELAGQGGTEPAASLNLAFQLYEVQHIWWHQSMTALGVFDWSERIRFGHGRSDVAQDAAKPIWLGPCEVF